MFICIVFFLLLEKLHCLHCKGDQQWELRGLWVSPISSTLGLVGLWHANSLAVETHRSWASEGTKENRVLGATQTKRLLREKELAPETAKQSSLGNIQQGLHHFTKTDCVTQKLRTENHPTVALTLLLLCFWKLYKNVSKLCPSWISKTWCSDFLLTPLHTERTIYAPKTGPITDVHQLPQCFLPTLGQEPLDS